MMTTRTLALATAVLLGACGSDGGTDPGSGTHTLFVDGRVSSDGGGAEIRITVRRAGVDVPDAVVTVESNDQEITLAYDAGDGEYRGFMPLWGSYYAIDVRAGDDHLDGSITAPEPAILVTPDPTIAIDARTAPGGVVRLEWDGDSADSVRVKSADFEYRGADEGRVDMPATFLKEDQQDLEISRDNTVILAGGTAGSSLRAQHEIKTTLIVLNSF
jgi:hypothetical protein